MEKFLRKYDRECMKMAILKHEDTFRQQVHELHRLYRVQRLLMRDAKSNELRRQQRVRKCPQAHQLEKEEEDKRCELRRRSRTLINLELSADEYIEREREDGLIIEQEIDVELTLTVGNSTQNNTSYQHGMIRNGRAIEFEEGMGENRLKQSPWLIHCLSLKMA